MKTAKILSTMAALFLVGAGCTPEAVAPSVQTKPAGDLTAPATTTQTTPPVVDGSTPPGTTDLILLAEPIGGKIVRVSFELPTELKTEDIQAYRLMLSREAEPTRENASNWFDLGTAHQKKDWYVGTTGQRYVRMCVVRADKCDVYSNTVAVEVQ